MRFAGSDTSRQTAEGANKQSALSNFGLRDFVYLLAQAFAVAVLVRSCCMSCRMAAILPGERCSDHAS